MKAASAWPDLGARLVARHRQRGERLVQAAGEVGRRGDSLGRPADGSDVDERHELRHEPRLTCADYAVLCDAAADGLGVAFLPDHACAAHIAAGKLVRVFRDWRSRDGIVHIVFTTRRGLPPAVRALIDHLAKEFPDL